MPPEGRRNSGNKPALAGPSGSYTAGTTRKEGSAVLGLTPMTLYPSTRMTVGLFKSPCSPEHKARVRSWWMTQ